MVCLEVARPESVDLPTLKRNLVAQGYLRAFAHGEALGWRTRNGPWKTGLLCWLIQDRVRLAEDSGSAGWKRWKRPCAWVAAWPM